MKGLLLKDYYLLMKYCRSFLFLIVIMLAASVFSNNAFLFVYPCVLGGMLTVTLISYDEKEKWNMYSGTLPYTRPQIVSSKYIMGLILGAAVIILAVAAQGARMVFITDFEAGEIISLVITLAAVSVIPSAFVLPFVYKFGVEKGRIAYMVMIGVVCGSAFVITNLNFKSFTVNGKPGNVFLIAAAVVIYAVSWLLSISFYKKRDI